MALVVKRVPWEDDSGDSRDYQSGEGSLSSTDKTDHREAYIVYDSAHAVVTALQAKAATGIPVRGEALTGYPLVFANNIKATAKGEGGFAWMVTVEYVSLPFNPFSAETSTTRWSSQPNDEAVDQDAFGKPIVNASDESFDPPVVSSFYDWVMVRSRNLNQIDFNTAPWGPLMGAVNWSAGYRGFPPGTARCIAIDSESRTAGNFQFQRVTYQVAFRSRIRKGQDGTVKQLGWASVKINNGFRKKINGGSNNGKYEAILDTKGMPVTNPVLLTSDGSGQTDNSGFNVLEFRVPPDGNLDDLDSIV